MKKYIYVVECEDHSMMGGIQWYRVFEDAHRASNFFNSSIGKQKGSDLFVDEEKYLFTEDKGENPHIEMLLDEGDEKIGVVRRASILLWRSKEEKENPIEGDSANRFFRVLTLRKFELE